MTAKVALWISQQNSERSAMRMELSLAGCLSNGRSGAIAPALHIPEKRPSAVRHHNHDSHQLHEESDMETCQTREPWNKGKLVDQKPPRKPKNIWVIRIHLQNEPQFRDLA